MIEEYLTLYKVSFTDSNELYFACEDLMELHNILKVYNDFSCINSLGEVFVSINNSNEK